MKYEVVIFGYFGIHRNGKTIAHYSEICNLCDELNKYINILYYEGYEILSVSENASNQSYTILIKNK